MGRYFETVRTYSGSVTRIWGKSGAKEIAMVFQDLRGALNSLYTIKDQIKAAIRLHPGPCLKRRLKMKPLDC